MPHPQAVVAISPGHAKAVTAHKLIRTFFHLVGFEVFTAVTVKNAVFWDVAPCEYITTDVSEERVASIFRVEEISRARKNVRR
jgi:hypothetical protein